MVVHVREKVSPSQLSNHRLVTRYRTKSRGTALNIHFQGERDLTIAPVELPLTMHKDPLSTPGHAKLQRERSAVSAITYNYYTLMNDHAHFHPSVKLQTPHSKLQASNSKLRALNSKLQASNSKLRALSSKLQASNSKLRALNSKLQASNSKLRALSSKLQASNSKLRALNSKLQASNSKLRASNSKRQTSNSKHEAVPFSASVPRVSLSRYLPRCFGFCVHSGIANSR